MRKGIPNMTLANLFKLAKISISMGRNLTRNTATLTTNQYEALKRVAEEEYKRFMDYIDSLNREGQCKFMTYRGVSNDNFTNGHRYQTDKYAFHRVTVLKIRNNQGVWVTIDRSIEPFEA